MNLFNDESGYKVADMLRPEELHDWAAAIKSHDWEAVRSLERLARKRRGGGLCPDDGVFTRN